jgi:malate permease and related proteins
VFLELVSIIAPVFVCAALGFAWSRSGKPIATTTLSDLVVYVGAPCLIFHTLVTTEADRASLSRMSGLALTLIAGTVVANTLLLRALRWPVRNYLGPLTFANTGNLGIPICYFAFGEPGLALAVAYFSTSFMVHSLAGDFIFAGQRSIRPLLTSPLFYAAMLSVLVLVLELPVPKIVLRTTQLLGGLTIPLMLITLGVSLSNLSAARFDRSLILSALRIGVGLAVALGIATCLGLEGTTRGVFILEASMPVGVLNYVFAQRYDREPVQIASLVLTSTLASLATIPAILSFLLAG